MGDIDRPRAMNAEAIVDSQNYRITLYIVGWVINRTGVPRVKFINTETYPG